MFKSPLAIFLSLVAIAVLLCSALFWRDHLLQESAQPIVSPSERMLAAARAKPKTKTNIVEEVIEEPVEEEAVSIDEETQLELEEMQVQYEALMEWILDNVRGTYPLPEHLTTNISLAAMADDLSLDGDIAELLNMTDQEQDNVNGIFNYAIDSIADIEASLLEIQETDSGKVTFHIPTYAEMGEELLDEMSSAMTDTLGADRAARFNLFTAQDLAENLHYFGRAAHTIVMEPMPVNDNTPGWRIRDAWISDSEEENTRVIEVEERSVVSIPAKYDALLNLLPVKTGSEPNDQEELTDELP